MDLIPSFPLSFEPSLLTDGDFDADFFLHDLRKVSSLEDIETDLRKYLAFVRNQLMELLNRDYGIFLQLSHKLDGTDMVVATLRAQLEALSICINEVKEWIDKKTDDAKVMLQNRREIEDQRRMLENSLMILVTIEKVKNLLNLKLSTEGVTTLKEQEEAHLMERVAYEFNLAQVYVSRAGDTSLASIAKQELSQVSKILLKRLNTVFLSANKSQAESIIIHALRAYASVGWQAVAEQLVEERIIRPYVQHGTDLDLASALDGVVTFISDDLAVLLKLSLDQPEFDFLGRSLWPALLPVFKARDVHAVGVPAEFHKNFRLCMRFVGQVESLCGGVYQLQQMRGSNAFQEFMHGFDLQVYWMLRVREMSVSLFQQALTPGSSDASSLHPVIAATLDALDFLTADDVLLTQVHSLCAQECVGLFQKLLAFFQSILDPTIAPLPEPLTLEVIVAAFRDLSWLSHTIFSQCKQTESGVLPASPYKGRVLPAWVVGSQRLNHGHLWRDVWTKCAKLCSDARQVLWKHMIELVIAQSTASLAAVRGMTAALRVSTNKTIPSRPSVYVASIFVPLTSWLKQIKSDEVAVSVASEETVEAIAAVVRHVSEHYMGLMKQQIKSLLDSEIAMEKLRKSHKQELKTSMLVESQFLLDMKAYEKAVEGFGFTMLGISEWGEFYQSVLSRHDSGPDLS